MFPKHPLYQTFCETLISEYDLDRNLAERVLNHAYLVPDAENFTKPLKETIIDGIRLQTEPALYLIDKDSYDAFTLFPQSAHILDKIESEGISLAPLSRNEFLKSLVVFLKEEQANTLIGVDVPPVSDYDQFHFERYETYESFIQGASQLLMMDLSKTYATIGGTSPIYDQTISKAYNLQELHEKNLAFFENLNVDDIKDHYQTELYRWHSIPISDTEEFWYYIEEQLVD